MSLIDTDIEHTESPTDEGVVAEFTAGESFDFEGEQVGRETTVALLADGGIHITQTTDQGTYDSLTLSQAVVDELVEEADDAN